MAKLVSIITPTYNLVSAGRETTFRQCMNSVAAQSYPNIEQIIVDGASTDGTLDLLKEYEGKAGVHIFSQPDLGIYNAYNKGILHSTGDILAFLNTDDFYHNPDAVRLSAEAIENSNALFSYASNYNLWPNGKRKVFHPNLMRAFRSMPISHQTFFCRREFFDKYGLHNESFKIAGDYGLYLRAIMDKAPHVELPDIIVTYRLGGVSNTFKDLADDEAALVLFENYQKPFGFSLEKCQQIVSRRYFDTPDLLTILKYLDITPKYPYLLYNYKYKVRSLRHR